MDEPIATKLRRSQVIILDGGTGTGIQRRGAPMRGDTGCAEVDPTHADDIAAGADVITANTFATGPLRFNAPGRDDALLEPLARERRCGRR